MARPIRREAPTGSDVRSVLLAYCLGRAADRTASEATVRRHRWYAEALEAGWAVPVNAGILAAAGIPTEGSTFFTLRPDGSLVPVDFSRRDILLNEALE